MRAHTRHPPSVPSHIITVQLQCLLGCFHPSTLHSPLSTPHPPVPLSPLNDTSQHHSH
ncbi:hypothetical protein CERZMDRAFT_122234 [Cercospora zeae-maydis SCOH1-5]|uniref:Uncharacterized protein n=1 Tax=Cercospora zeae-maydis SCOH1-5 TaxID=717836 RepID=A0A6A6F873_9PEZI|nr:hypothetical protein CERZMDRAFT_122234 [Cercospora zeae-maydis SCOH1-5]